MASKIEFQIEFEVGIEALWNAITKDKIDVLRKAASHLLDDARRLEGDGGLGTLNSINFGSVAPHIPPLKEKVVEFDESSHAVSFQGIEGGFFKLGLAYYIVSFKIEDLENEKVLVKTTLKYDLEEDIDGTQPVKEFTNLISEYLKSVASYLEKNNI